MNHTLCWRATFGSSFRVFSVTWARLTTSPCIWVSSFYKRKIVISWRNAHQTPCCQCFQNSSICTYLSLLPLFFEFEYTMPFVSMLATDHTHTFPVSLAKQIQGLVMLRAGSGSRGGKLRIHAAVPRASIGKNLQIDGLWWRSGGTSRRRTLLETIGPELLHSFH